MEHGFFGWSPFGEIDTTIDPNTAGEVGFTIKEEVPSDIDKGILGLSPGPLASPEEDPGIVNKFPEGINDWSTKKQVQWFGQNALTQGAKHAFKKFFPQAAEQIDYYKSKVENVIPGGKLKPKRSGFDFFWPF